MHQFDNDHSVKKSFQKIPRDKSNSEVAQNLEIFWTFKFIVIMNDSCNIFTTEYRAEFTPKKQKKISP